MDQTQDRRPHRRVRLRTKLLLLLIVVLGLAAIAWTWQAERLTQALHELFTESHREDRERLLFAELNRKRSDAELLALVLSQRKGHFIDATLEPVLLDRQILWTGMRLKAGKWRQWPAKKPPQVLTRLREQFVPKADRRQLPALSCQEGECTLIYRFRVPCENGLDGCELYLQQNLNAFLADYYALAGDDIFIRVFAPEGSRVLGTHARTYPDLIRKLYQPGLAAEELDNTLWPVEAGETKRFFLVQHVRAPAEWQGAEIYIVSDVHALVQFFTQLRIGVLVSLLGLGVLIFAALYVGLDRIVSQLETLEHAMNKVAAEEFDEAVKVLEALRHSRFEDELDGLIDETLETTVSLETLNKRLVHIAYHDELTGLKNRRAFEETIESVMNHPGVLVMIDLNRFKQVNDLYGHEAGDRALKALARRLQQFAAAYPGTEVFRLAGDEFVLWLPRTRKGAKVHAILQQLKERLDGWFSGPHGARIYIETSLGGVLVPEHAQGKEAALSKADKALYVAKRGDSPSGWHLFDPAADDDTPLIQREHAVLDIVREALAGNRFYFAYQPILNIHQRCISHYEVLLRLDDSQGNPISPADFIPVAERHGLSARIDEWVLRQALLKLQHTPQTVHLAINFSAATIQRRDLPQWVMAQLQDKAVAPSRLLIELTETAYVTNLQQARENLAALRAEGVRIALDDFGVGHASFNYLTQLPLDLVKLDGSYVRDLLSNRRHQALVEGITQIVHAWGIKVVAEYVEDGGILSLLAAAGVDFAQGYHIGRPRTRLHEQGQLTDCAQTDSGT